MKVKAAGILLLLSLVAPPAATFVFLTYQKMQVRYEVKQKIINGLESEALVVLAFTEAEAQKKLHWEHASEFAYNGQMYDVVETSVRGDTTYYRCWPDNEETQLNQQLNRLVAFALGDNPQRQHHQKQLIRFFNSLFWAPSPPFRWRLRVNLTTEPNTPYRFRYPRIAFPPPVPPPERT